MVKQILGEIKDEIGETIGNVGKQAKQAVKGVVADAGKQVSGNLQAGDAGQLTPWEQIVGKPMDPQQMQQKQQEEQINKQKNLNEVRANLKQLLEPPPKQQEPPKYIKAKIEKQQEMEKKREDEKKKPKWDVQAAKRMGSGETRGGQGVGG